MTTPEEFSFVYFTDPHVPRGPGERRPFEAFLERLASLSPRPAFAVSGGDIELQSGMGEEYLRLLERLPFPVRHVIGNHDLLVGEPDPKAEFRRLFGPTRCSFDYASAHFCILDGTRAHPELSGWRNVRGALSDEELAWLEDDLESAGRCGPLLLFMHIPPVSTFPQRRGKAPGDEPAWEVEGAERLVEICNRFGVDTVFSGHFHENERTRAGGTWFLSTGSVCGHWWQGGPGASLNMDGTPRGFRVVNVGPGGVRSRYVCLDGPPERQLRIVGPRQGEEAGQRLEIGVNVFDGAEETRVEFAVDESGWRPMRLTPQTAVKGKVFGCAHFWTGLADLDGLPDGEHRIAVRAADPYLRKGVEAVRFIYRPEHAR